MKEGTDMNTSKHTPGPWNLGNTHDREYMILSYQGPATIQIAQIAGRNFKGTLTPEGEANARLIAAAPQLLEALQRLMSPYLREPSRDHSSETMRLARAALALVQS
jgi:hypothetical protein